MVVAVAAAVALDSRLGVYHMPIDIFPNLNLPKASSLSFWS
jgi:hypothetical protein